MSSPFAPNNPGISGLHEFTSAEVDFVEGLVNLPYSRGDILYHDGSDLVNLPIGTDGQVLLVDTDIPSWETAPTGVLVFTELTDVPSSYTGQGTKLVSVKSDETGLEFGYTPHTSANSDTIALRDSSGRLAVSDAASNGQAVNLGQMNTGLAAKENSFSKGNLVAGTNITLSGTLTNRLVGSGDITITATGSSSGGQVDSVVGTTDEIDVDNTDPVNPVVSLATAVTTSLGKADTAVQNLSDLGITATASELNVLDGITSSTTELNYTDGVTSNIQTQLNAKQATITGGASTIVSSNLTTNRALISNGSGKVDVSDVTSTELGYLDGVTSAIQTQLDGKQSRNVYFGSTTTAAGTAAKVVTLDSPYASYTPQAGDFFVITYSGVAQSASNATLNINGDGAKNVRLANANANNTGHTTASGGRLMYLYDGTYYHLVGSQLSSNTTYAEISEAEITTGTASTARTISGRRAEFIVQKALSQSVLLTGNQSIDGVKTFTSFPVTPSSAPTTDYQVANKKYVDDNSSSLTVEEEGETPVSNVNNIIFKGATVTDLTGGDVEVEVSSSGSNIIVNDVEVVVPIDGSVTPRAISLNDSENLGYPAFASNDYPSEYRNIIGLTTDKLESGDFGYPTQLGTSGHANAWATSGSNSFTVPAGNNRMLIIQANRLSGSISTMLFDGTPMTILDTNGTATFYYRLMGSGAAVTANISWTASGNVDTAVVGFCLQNVVQQAPIQLYSGTTSSTSVSTTYDGSIILALNSNSGASPAMNNLHANTIVQNAWGSPSTGAFSRIGEKAGSKTISFTASTTVKIYEIEAIDKTFPTISVKKYGIQEGFSGLTLRTKYYVQDNGTLGSSAGTNPLPVGKTLTPTELVIDTTF